jgi:putative phosphoribosyl transferase
MFEDRKDAGQKLGKALEAYKGCKGIVLAIPKGGVEVAHYVAKHLKLPMSLVIVRKLPFPDNPEAGFGAIAEDGGIFFADRFQERIPPSTAEIIIEEQKEELKRRVNVLREGRPLPELQNKTAILVDDGIAMGSSMQVAVMLCKNQRAKKIVIAVPVAGKEVASELEKMVDDIIVLEKPASFRAVAQVYEDWYDVSDEEVISILQKEKNYQSISFEE